MKNLLPAIALACLVVLGQPARAQNIINSNNTVVRFEVLTGGAHFGNLNIELFDQEKPETVRNFLVYVYSGAYTNMALHRLIPNFVAQGGRVVITNPASSDAFSSYVSGQNYGQVTNEYSVGPELSNDYGTIAMARVGGDTNSASAEFFINLTNNPFLNNVDGGFTVFGHVVNTSDERSGTNLLNHFNTFSAGHGISFASLVNPFEFFGDLPVSTNRASGTAYADLFTINASIIQGAQPTDSVAPTVSVLAPADEIRTTSGTITFSGTASDDRNLIRVLCDTPLGRFSATGKENWTRELKLLLGTNHVAVRSLDQFGNLSPAVDRTIVYSVQVALQILGKGKVTGITNGQILEAGVTNTLVAKPPPGQYFVGWRGSVFSNERTYSFTAQGDTTNIIAKFSRNLLGLTTGPYNGLFFPGGSGPLRNAGLITLNVSAHGEYFGHLTPLGTTYQIHGKFGTNGTSVITGQQGTNGLALALTLYPESDAILGTYFDGQYASSVGMLHVEKFGPTNPAPAGNYTFTISPTLDTNRTVVPDGSGFGTVTIDTRGRIKMSGTLADETAIRQNASLVKGNRWPFFAPAYRGHGGVVGWATFGSNNVITAETGMKWFAPGFPGDTNQNARLSGSPYTPPSQARLFNWTNGIVTLSGDGLAEAITADVLLNEDGSFTVPSNTNNIQLSVTDKSGLLTGSFTHPISQATTALKGAVLQSSNTAAGYFPGTPRDGALLIRRAP